MTLLALGGVALAAVCAGTSLPGVALPGSSLSARDASGWHEWWRSDRAPSQYGNGANALASRVKWRAAAAGMQWGDVELSGSGEAWRTRVVVVRLDPARVRLSLDTAFAGGNAAWSLDKARGGAVMAVNAGQFVQSMPWGWVVLDGHQFLAASVAPLVTTVTVSSEGAVRFTHATLPDSAGVRWAFQSYPTLLAARAVPQPLRAAECGVDVAHRDARLAVGVDANGRLLVAMTRFDALGGTLERVPFGLTTPEMAAVMGALGATDAVLLDGGISAQLLVRDAGGIAHRWRGVRKVPLALIAVPR